jgi:hypothetical protein
VTPAGTVGFYIGNLPRPSDGSAAGAIFVTAGGVRCFVPDHWLVEVELSEQGRLLRLTSAGCSVEVAGQRLEGLVEDAIVARLGRLLQTPSMPELPHQPWISSIVAMVPALADSKLDRR